MSEYRFGRIENLDVRDGEPFLTDEVRIARVLKLGARNDPITENAVEFELKQPVRDLFEQLRQIQQGKVLIEFRHGLPVLLEVITDILSGFDQ